MANKLWDFVKSAANTVKNAIVGNNNSSAGSSGAGASAAKPATTSAQSQSTPSGITSYNSGIRGTREYARQNNQAFQQQYQLARKAGVSDNQFYQDYYNGTRWVDEANNTSRIRQYNSGVAGTREYAKANMPEFRTQYDLARKAGISDNDFYTLYAQGNRWVDDAATQRIVSYDSGTPGTREYAKANNDEFQAQYQMAKQAGWNDDEFYSDYARGTRWRAEDINAPEPAGSEGGEGKEPDLLSKATSFVNDSQFWNNMQDRRLKRWQEKYGSATFADDFFGQTGANYSVGFLSQELNRVYNDLADNPNDEHDVQYAKELEELLQNFQTRNTEALDDVNAQATWISKHMAAYAPQLVSEVVPALGVAAVAAGASAVGLVGAGVVSAAWTAYRFSRIATSAINAYEVTRGASYAALTQAGANANVARAASTDEAIISSVIEMGDTAIELFGIIPGVGKAFDKIGEIGLVKAVSRILKSYPVNIAQEGGEEFLQETLSAANRERILAGDGNNGISGLLSYYKRFLVQMAKGEHSDELAQAMEAAKGGAIIGAVMGGAHIAGGKIQSGINNTQVANVLTRVEENPDGILRANDETLQYYLDKAKAEGKTHNENAAKIIQQELDLREKFRGGTTIKETDSDGNVTTKRITAEEKAELKKSLESITREDITADKVNFLGLHILYDQCLATGADSRVADMLCDEWWSRENASAQQQAEMDAQTRQQAQEASNPVAETPTEMPAAETPVEASTVPTETVAETPAAVEEPIAPITEPATDSTEAVSEEASESGIEAAKKAIREISDEELASRLDKAVTDKDAEGERLARNEMLRRKTIRGHEWWKGKGGKLAPAPQKSGEPPTRLAPNSHWKHPFGNNTFGLNGLNAREADSVIKQQENKAIEKKSDSQQKRETWGDTQKDAERQSNPYPADNDATAQDRISGEMIPLSLDTRDIDSYAEAWGMTDDELGEAVSNLLGNINEYGYQGVYGHSPSVEERNRVETILDELFKTDENGELIKAPSGEEVLGALREYNLYMSGDSSHSNINTNGELGKEKMVGVRTVYEANDADGNPVERTELYPDIIGNGDSDFITTNAGGKILSDTEVHSFFRAMKSFFRRFKIQTIVPVSSFFSFQTYNSNTGILSDLDADIGGIQASYTGNPDTAIACDINEAGVFLHESGHHLQALAELVDSKKAQALIESMIQNALGDDFDNAYAGIAKSYKSTIKRRADNSYAKWESRSENKNKPADYKALYKQYLYLKTEADVVQREIFADITGGNYTSRTGMFIQAQKKLVNSAEFRRLLLMAGQAAGVTNNDVNVLLRFYSFAAEKSNGQKALTLVETVQAFQEYASQEAERKRTNGTERVSGGLESLSGNERGIAGSDKFSGGEFGRPRSDRRTQRVGQRTEKSTAEQAAAGRNAGLYRGEQGPLRNYYQNADSRDSKNLANPASDREAYNESMRYEVPAHTEEDYRETYGRTGFEEQQQKYPLFSDRENEPAYTSAEERAAMQQQDYEDREQTAHDVAEARRDRIKFDYHDRETAWKIFNSAMDISERKFDFDSIADDRRTYEDKQRIKAMDSLRNTAKAVGEGRITAYEFAKFLQNSQRDQYLGQYLNEDIERHLLTAVQNVIDAYENATESASPAVANRYSFESLRTMQMLDRRMEHWNAADRLKVALGAETDQTVGKSKRASARKARFNQSGERLSDTAANFLTRMQINPTNVLRGLVAGWDKYGNKEGYRLSEAQDKATAKHQTIISNAQMAYLDVRKMKGFQKFAEQKDTKKVNIMGRELNLSQQQIVALYKTARTLAADERANIEEMVIVDGEGNEQRLNGDGNLKHTANGEVTGTRSITHADFREMMRALWSQIDDVGMAYLEATNDTLEDLGKQNSDVEQKVYGYTPKLYKKGEYIPVRYVPKGKTVKTADDTVQFYSFNEERTREEGGTVMVEPVTQVIDRYINQSANHIAYTELGDQFALMNRADSTNRTLSEIMAENYGEQMRQWMDIYVRDLNNYNPKEKEDGVSTLLRKGRQAVQTGALVGSVSVPLKQISSYWAAAGRLRMSTLRKAYRIKLVGAKGMNPNNPLLYYRKVGGLDPTISEIMKSDGLMAKLRSKSKLYQMMEKSIPAMDYRTIDNLYTACCIEIKEDNPRLDVNSEKYQQLVNEKFEDVVISTQPIFTRNARAEYARTDNEFIKLFSMFRTQQTQNLNNIFQAIGEARAAKGTIGEFKAIERRNETIKGQITSALSLAVLTALSDFVLHKHKKYKDEDGEVDPEKVLERIGLNAIEGASGSVWFADSLLKFAIDKVNAAQGKSSNEFYGVNMGIVSTIGSIMDSIGNLVENPTLSNLQYTAGYMAQALGLPLSNVYRGLNATIMWARDIQGENDGDYDDILRYLENEVMVMPKATAKNRMHIATNYELKGNSEKASNIYSEIAGYENTKTLARNEAKSRYMSGKISREESENLLLRFGEMSEEDAGKRNDLWEFLKEHPKYQDTDEYNISESFVQKYNNIAQPAGISANSFYDYMQQFNNTRSIDVDGDGKTNGKNDVSKQAQMIEYINSLSISKEQKDALWLAFGYSTTSKAYKNRPWK